MTNFEIIVNNVGDIDDDESDYDDDYKIYRQVCVLPLLIFHLADCE